VSYVIPNVPPPQGDLAAFGVTSLRSHQSLNDPFSGTDLFAVSGSFVLTRFEGDRVFATFDYIARRARMR
jgi:hypothetical protein